MYISFYSKSKLLIPFKNFLLFFSEFYRAVATFIKESCASFFCMFSMSLFVIHAQLGGTVCSLHNQTTFAHELEYLDCKGHRTYPVVWKKENPSIIVVPASKSQQAQCLIAATYCAVQDSNIDTVILLCQGDEHQFYGVALPLDLQNKKNFYNLLVAFDHVEKFSEHRLFHYYQAPFTHNESILLQSKFLDFYMKKVKIIPLVVGSISQEDASAVADMIILESSLKTLVVISGDIGSYENLVHDNPCDISKNCKVYDRDASFIQMVQSIGFQENNEVKYEMVSSAFTILFALLRKPYYKNLVSYFVGYVTSCSCPIAMELVESYGAFIFQKTDQQGYKNYIGCYEQLQLLQAARLELHNFFGQKSLRLPCMRSYEMLQPHGVFASLYLMTDHSLILRGSMGKVTTKFSLFNMVGQMTQQAAYKDDRFYALRHEEVHETIISLSIVNDLKEVKNFEFIEETQGVMLQYNGQQAVSLPLKFSTNLPVQIWNYESVLTKLSWQIKLHSCLWKKPRAKVFTFRPQLFQEE